jgi:hypothetical protein
MAPMVVKKDFHSETEEAIANQLQSLQKHVSDVWAGQEQRALIEIVRALDIVAAKELDDSGLHLPKRTEAERFYALRGAAPALRPFLAKVHDVPGGVPWGPSSSAASKFFNSYVILCGQLAHLRRMANLERYGLSTTSVGPAGPIIELEIGQEEFAQRFAMQEATPKDLALGLSGSKHKKLQRRISRRMSAYVDSVDNWFISYDNDMEIVQTYRQKAANYGARYLEGEALPDKSDVGDRTFADWRDACDQALGRVLCHIDFTQALQRKQTGIALEDVTTLFVRKDDIREIWKEAGLQEDRVEATMRALTLSTDDLDTWERDFEVPCPFYVELGRDFLLLPCFGALTNPYIALFRHLRTNYRSDWDSAVDGREDIFRQDLAREFHQARYHVPSRGFDLKRHDGSLLTDIDAVIVDKQRGSFALVQLKWSDVFGRSLIERESRRKNILVANKWIERVTSWIDGRSAAEVAKELGVQEVSATDPPILYVVARYTARFSNELDQDKRAAWISWHEILHLLPTLDDTDPLTDLPAAVVRHQLRFAFSEPSIETFAFPEINVELRVYPKGERGACTT